jgi:hypothetical protein
VFALCPQPAVTGVRNQPARKFANQAKKTPKFCAPGGGLAGPIVMEGLSPLHRNSFSARKIEMNARFGLLLTVGMFLALPYQPSRAAGAENARKPADTPANRAAATVREALQREIYGQDTDRGQLLAGCWRALNMAPRGGAGLCSRRQTGLEPARRVLAGGERSSRLQAYERQRARRSPWKGNCSSPIGVRSTIWRTRSGRI